MKPYILFLLFLISGFSLSAQVSINDLSVQPGFVIMGNAAGSLNDFKKLAPQSSLLNNDFSNFNEKGNYNTSVTGMFSVLLGLRFNEKKQNILRLGISYYGGNHLSAGYEKHQSTPYDTLISTQTGIGYILDSNNRKDYSMDYSVEQLRFDASLIHNFMPASRVSLFAGIGLTAGYSINSKTKIAYSDRTGFGYIISDNVYTNYKPYREFTQKESFRNKNNFIFSAYLPMGIDFRLGKKREFFKRIHLFYELRPGINIMPVAELRTYTSVCLQNGFGLRVMWN